MSKTCELESIMNHELAQSIHYFSVRYGFMNKAMDAEGASRDLQHAGNAAAPESVSGRVGDRGGGGWWVDGSLMDDEVGLQTRQLHSGHVAFNSAGHVKITAESLMYLANFSSFSLSHTVYPFHFQSPRMVTETHTCHIVTRGAEVGRDRPRMAKSRLASRSYMFRPGPLQAPSRDLPSLPSHCFERNSLVAPSPRFAYSMPSLQPLPSGDVGANTIMSLQFNNP